MDMKVATTFGAAAPTYYGAHGHTSYIDHFAVPNQKQVTNRTCLRSMRRLQLIKDEAPRDHVLVEFIVPVLVRHESRAREYVLKVDRDRLMDGVP